MRENELPRNFSANFASCNSWEANIKNQSYLVSMNDRINVLRTSYSILDRKALLFFIYRIFNDLIRTFYYYFFFLYKYKAIHDS